MIVDSNIGTSILPLCGHVLEAIVNAMVAGRDLQGQDRHYAIAIPHQALRELLRKYNRLVTP